MSTPLMPEKRLDKNNVLVTKYVKAEQPNAAPRIPMPAPTVNGTGRNQSLFEKLVDNVLEFLLGPSTQDSEKDSEARELLRGRIAELPERTLSYLKSTWQEIEKNADEGLDRTEFGRFSQTVGADLKSLIFREFEAGSSSSEVAQDIENLVRAARDQATAFRVRQATRASRAATAAAASAAATYQAGFGNQEPQHFEDDGEFVHEGAIHDAPGTPVYHSPAPTPAQEPRRPTGLDSLGDMMDRPRRGTSDSHDPLLGGSGV